MYTSQKERMLGIHPKRTLKTSFESPETRSSLKFDHDKDYDSDTFSKILDLKHLMLMLWKA